MKVKDLQFDPHPAGIPGSRAVARFPNGYGASIVTGTLFYTSETEPYEVAVLGKGNRPIYNTPITHDVLGYLTEEEVNAVLAAIEALPPLEATNG